MGGRWPCCAAAALCRWVGAEACWLVVEQRKLGRSVACRRGSLGLPASDAGRPLNLAPCACASFPHPSAVHRRVPRGPHPHAGHRIHGVWRLVARAAAQECGGPAHLCMVQAVSGRGRRGVLGGCGSAVRLHQAADHGWAKRWVRGRGESGSAGWTKGVQEAWGPTTALRQPSVVLPLSCRAWPAAVRCG